MGTTVIDDDRIQPLNHRPDRDGDCVVYWMQQSQRAEFNPALEFAVQQANQRQLPLLVGFGLMDDYPEANLRHYRFMLEGLRETGQALRRRGIAFVIRRGHPADVALHFAKSAALLVCDRGYLRHQKQWRRKVAEKAPCDVVQVEADVVVPVEVASDKAEFAARTIRPKIHREWNRFLEDLRTTPLEDKALELAEESLDLDDLDRVLSKMQLDRSVPPVSHFFRGGTREAKRLLKGFFKRHLDGYAEHRNQPQTDFVSHISKYLHFGQVSPVYVALQARQADKSLKDDRAAFLEELIVRRELACNFVEFTDNYDQFDALPRWAKETLARHQKDKRPYIYSKAELEAARTHDAYWNAAMREMKYTGYMHNAMRMYWGKKILEWSRTPEEAFAATLSLNNTYFLDGRDPNSYANVLWVFGLHDRPWKERDVFGKVRYMNAAGLERKCDIQAYVRKVDDLVGEARKHGVRFGSDD